MSRAAVESATFPSPTLRPTWPVHVHLSLTVVFTCLYGLLFAQAFVQIAMMVWFRQKRLSHQAALLFLSLMWAALRTTLFSFYFHNTVLSNRLGTPLYWLFFCCPVCLQFGMLNVILLYFLQLVYRDKARENPRRYKHLFWALGGVGMLTFAVTNLASAIVEKWQQQRSDLLASDWPVYTNRAVRVLVNDLLFILISVWLAYLLYHLIRIPSLAGVIAAQGFSARQALVLSGLIIFLFVSRAVYNLFAICPHVGDDMPNFGFNWINVSDQADVFDTGGEQLPETYRYITFGAVLFVWEFLPTQAVVLFFRVRVPRRAHAPVLSDPDSRHFDAKSFFTNPRRYDNSTDQLSINNSVPDIGAWLSHIVSPLGRGARSSFPDSGGGSGRQLSGSDFIQSSTPVRPHRGGRHSHGGQSAASVIDGGGGGAAPVWSGRHDNSAADGRGEGGGGAGDIDVDDIPPVLFSTIED